MSDLVLKSVLSLRWIPVILFALPLSKLIRIYSWLRKLFRARYFPSRPLEHRQRVERVQKQVREKSKRALATGNLLCTARPALFMTTIRQCEYKNKENAIDLPLHDILSFDEATGTIKAEPLVTMGDLSSFLIPRGWTLAVLPELDDLTVGGLLNGYGIESSSHKYGLFFDCVLEADIVVASGELVTCSREQNADLFDALSWNCGALGFVVSVTLSVIRCQPFVRVTYTPFAQGADLCRRFREESLRSDPHEFLEALVLDRSSGGGVMLTGDFCTEKNGLPVNSLSAYNAEWFYKQVEKHLVSGKTHTELVPLKDWYHRHTSSLFWEMELILPMGNSWLFRNLLGWLKPISIPLLKLSHTKTLAAFYDKAHVAQDFLVPIESLEDALAKAHALYDIYPIWLCPHQVRESKGALQVREGKDVDMYVDVGLYGISTKVDRGEEFDGRTATAAYEKWLIANKGYSALYASVELSREEFAAMFDRTLYREMRHKWGAEGVLADTYDKIKR